MSTTVEKIEKRLGDAFKLDAITIHDHSHHHAGHDTNQSGGGHFSLHLKSENLKALSKVKAHQKIYQALDGMIPYPIHALAIHLD